jgi:hypothetical protein
MQKWQEAEANDGERRRTGFDHAGNLAQYVLLPFVENTDKT